MNKINFRKSQLIYRSEIIIFLIIVFGGTLALTSASDNFLVVGSILSLLFGLYFGLNVLTRFFLFRDRIGNQISLDETKKILFIDTKEVKFSSIKNVKNEYLRRLGWQITLTLKKETVIFITPDGQELYKLLKDYKNIK
jgi:intracellular septation protein A